MECDSAFVLVLDVRLLTARPRSPDDPRAVSQPDLSEKLRNPEQLRGSGFSRFAPL
jgi:hypothetical protein